MKVSNGTNATDPPMKRTGGSVVWFESGPEPILEDPDPATDRPNRAGKQRDQLAATVCRECFLVVASSASLCKQVVLEVAP